MRTARAAAAARLRARAAADGHLVRAGAAPARPVRGLCAGTPADCGRARRGRPRAPACSVEQTRMLGAGRGRRTMLLAGGRERVARAWSRASPMSPAPSPALPSSASSLNLVMALGMQLMTFEDMTYELRTHEPPARIGAVGSAADGHDRRADRLPQPALLRPGDHREVCSAIAATGSRCRWCSSTSIASR